MIKTVTKAGMPVDEVLHIRKNRLMPENISGKKRISIVTGIHGDELEGQYVCYEVSRRIKEHPEYPVVDEGSLMARILNTNNPSIRRFM